MRGQGMVSPAAQEEERQFEAALRPTRLDDFEGQPHLKEQLSIAIEAAKRRGEAMDHVLLCGPPGLGKTTLAGIIAQELSVPLDQTAGPVLQKKVDLTGIVTNIKARQVFFVDEIHRLLPDIQELLYSVLEDFRVALLDGGGPVGLNTIAASIDEQPDTIEEVYEPYLMQLGFLDRTPRGRMATDRAFEYFQVPRGVRFGNAQPPLF